MLRNISLGLLGLALASTASAQVVLNNANGHFYEVVFTNLSWSDAKVTAENSTHMGMPGHLVTIADQAEMDWLITNLTWDRPWIGGFQDINDPAYSEPGGGWKWVTDEPFTYTNWGAGEPNDNPVGENHIELLFNIGGSSSSNGAWNDTIDASPFFHSYIVEYEPIAGTSLSCDPASPHFGGSYVTLESSALGATTPSGLHLEATDGPAGEFGFFLVSSDNTVTINVFNGVLCLGSPQGRYNPNAATNQGLPELNSLGQFDAAGVLQSLVGTAPSTGGSGYDVPLELPLTPAGQSIQPGETWYFQCWYRDQLVSPGDSANFSNVIGVTF